MREFCILPVQLVLAAMHERNRNRERKSAPVVLQDQSKSDISGGGAERVTKSSCSTSFARSLSDVYEGICQNLRVFTVSQLKQKCNFWEWYINQILSNLDILTLSYLHEELEVQSCAYCIFLTWYAQSQTPRPGIKSGHVFHFPLLVIRTTILKVGGGVISPRLSLTFRDGKKFGMLMYSRLKNRYSISPTRKMAKLADTCLLKSAKDRPKISQVVQTLKKIILTFTISI
uniref:Serine-threonine/tyrosine-protein kinase catalytic domain-containing protein n=1 Tax=Solanum lycopersicum TaxID=4081 RepID=K4B4N1_SOLLC